MEMKKTLKTDLESKKVLFFEFGLACALLITILAFNWASTEKQQSMLLSGPRTIIDEEPLPVTYHNTPPQEIIKAPLISEQIVIVDNEVPVIDVTFDTEDLKNLGVTTLSYVKEKKIEIEEKIIEEEVIPDYFFVEVKPTFQGGDPNHFSRWVNSQVVYPPVAAENGIEGTVLLYFEVGIDGKLCNIKVTRSVDPLLDQEALRVVKMSPLWVPGKQHGKVVKVSYQFPVKFKLNK